MRCVVRKWKENKSPNKYRLRASLVTTTLLHYQLLIQLIVLTNVNSPKVSHHTAKQIETCHRNLIQLQSFLVAKRLRRI